MQNYAKRIIPDYEIMTEIPDGHLPKDLDPYGYEDNWSNAFNDCLKLISLPDPFYNWNGAINISNIFYSCNRLKCSIPKIPNSVINMGYAFRECANLTGSIPNIPNSVTDMGYTFFWCRNLTGSIPNIPNSVTNMANAFGHCTNLTGSIPNIPDSVVYMNFTFGYCYKLTGSIPNIPNSVINMAYAFMTCYNLTGSIPNIPDSVTNMGYAFEQCRNLKNSNVYIHGDNLDENRIARCFYNIPAIINIYCHANTNTYDAFLNYVRESNSMGSNGPRYLYTFE